MGEGGAGGSIQENSKDIRNLGVEGNFQVQGTSLGQYNSPGEYCGPHTASSVFLIILVQE